MICKKKCFCLALGAGLLNARGTLGEDPACPCLRPALAEAATPKASNPRLRLRNLAVEVLTLLALLQLRLL